MSLWSSQQRPIGLLFAHSPTGVFGGGIFVGFVSISRTGRLPFGSLYIRNPLSATKKGELFIPPPIRLLLTRLGRSVYRSTGMMLSFRVAKSARNSLFCIPLLGISSALDNSHCGRGLANVKEIGIVIARRR